MNKILVLFTCFIAAMLLIAGCAKSPTGAEALCDEDGCPEPVEEGGIVPTEIIEDDIKVVVAQEISDDVSEVSDNEPLLPTKTVSEGDMVSFPNLKATDPDGDPITYTFSEPLDNDGTWQTEEGDAGIYQVTITASDGKNKIEQDVKIVVKSANNLPELSAPEHVIISEGKTLELDVSATDADGDEVTIEFSGWMTSSTKELGYDDEGLHKVTVLASDGKDVVKQKITVVVENVNRAPQLDEIGSVEADEGEAITIFPTASDPDGDLIEFTFSDYFDEEGEWQTHVGDAGIYYITVTATDGTATDSERVTVDVISLNKPPVLKGVEDIEVDEGESVVLQVYAEDPEGETVEVIFTGWMTSDTKDTDFNDAGEYMVTAIASDGVNEARASFVVIVNELNRPPVFGEGAFD